jgi:hypothetical protein
VSEHTPTKSGSTLLQTAWDSAWQSVCHGCHLAVPCVRGQEHQELMATVYEDKQNKGLTIVPAIDSTSVLWHHSQTGARLHQAGATAPQLSAAISRAGHPNFLHERCCSILLLRLAVPHFWNSMALCRDCAWPHPVTIRSTYYQLMLVKYANGPSTDYMREA